MAIRVPTAREQREHRGRLIAIKECLNGYNHPVHILDDPMLTEEDKQKIKSWEGYEIIEVAGFCYNAQHEMM